MPSEVRCNFDESIKFLKLFHPGRLWMLTAIPPDQKKVATETFDAGNEGAAMKWLDDHSECNIYFSVGEPIGPMTKKAERTDIKAVHWLHVDVDPRAGEDLDAERKRIEKMLRNPPSGVPKPTCVVFSGGGFQGFWKLKDPINIGGSQEKAEAAKRYNMQLELLLGGDQCHNIDRIMRLPGTVNHPNERKRKHGRTAKLAVVVEWSGLEYDLKEFTPAPEVQSKQRFSSGKTVEVSGNIRRLESVDELPDKVSGTCKIVIVQGMDPDDPGRFKSRSHALYYVCCELVRCGVDDDTIYSIITDPGFRISESVVDKGSNTHRYALRQIESARENAINPWLRRLNERYAVVGNWGGKCRVLTEVEEVIGDSRRSRIHLLSFEDFRNYHCNKFVETGTNKTGDTIYAPVGKWWLGHPMRREYGTVTFAPGYDIEGAYNLWKGFAFAARPGDCSLFLNHVRDNICRGDESTYEYLLSWMATAVQHPARPGYSAVVLRGRQGTGKGQFANHFGALFGRHFLPIRDSAHLFGQFNAHLRDCSILFADEALWAGNKKHESLLKSLITEETIVSEAKGRDAEVSPNFIHLIMASNEDWVVPANVDDRRFLVLDVGDEKMQDVAFFSKLCAQMNKGGYEALLHTLMTKDLSEYNVRRIPQTAALLEQKVRTFSGEEEWWFSKLQSSRIVEDDESWPQRVYVSAMCYDFTTYCRLWGSTSRSNSTRLGKFMNKALPSGSVTRVQLAGEHMVMHQDGCKRPTKRPHAYLVPSLEECREHWDKHFGGPYTWPEIRNDG